MIKVVISLMDQVRNIRFIKNLLQQIWIKINLRVQKDWRAFSEGKSFSLSSINHTFRCFFFLAELFEQIQEIFARTTNNKQRIHFNEEVYELQQPQEKRRLNHWGNTQFNLISIFFTLLLIISVRWRRHFHVGKLNKLLIGYMALVLVNMQVNVESILKMVYNFFMQHHKN